MKTWSRVRLSIPTVIVSIALATGGLTAVTPPLVASAADFTAQTWRSVEIPLTSTVSYSDPFSDVDVTATFTSPGSASITRPAFWDGSGVWKVRFAATSAGTWTMTTSATNASDGGLNGVTKTIAVTPYSGSLEIYQRGFLTPSTDKHYLTYRDGTPFLYLGDTHWVLPHERWASSSVSGVPSQFKYTVDKRVSQGFTVYQSEPIQQPQGNHNPGPDEQPVVTVGNGMIGSDDLAGFANLDRKFAYIADSGLVHSNAMIDWVDQLNNVSPTQAGKLGRYWDARYGAYPVIWTIAQELDQNRYGAVTPAGVAAWDAAIVALDAADSYNDPIMPHQESTDTTTAGNSRYCPYPYSSCPSWFDGYAAQPTMIDNWDFARLQTYWSSGHPALAYETKYDKLDSTQNGYQLGTDSRHALSAFYKAYLSGMRGYGYGINGLWNDIYSKQGEPLDAGTDYGASNYKWWYDAANDATAGKLQYGMTLLRGLEWWKLTPRFANTDWSDFGSGGNKFLATDSNNTYVALFADGTTSSGTLRGLSTSATYSASWMDPNTGTTTVIGNFSTTTGAWSAPMKPSTADYVLVVKKNTASTVTPTCSTTQNPAVPEVDLTESASSFFASSSLTNQQPDFAFDNSGGTNWQAGSGTFAGQYLGVNFGRTVRFDSIVISEFAQRTRGFRIEYFSAGTWSVAYTSPPGFSGFGDTSSPSTIAFPAVSGSQARIFYLSGTQYAPIVYDMSVLGYSDLSIGATASSPQTARTGQEPAKAIDKNNSTDWQPIEGSLDGSSIALDWGSQRTINRVTVSEYGNRSAAYRVQYSTDGTTWRDACSGSGGFGASSSTTTTVSFEPVTGRALRILFDHVTAYSPIIYELGVFAA